MPAQRGLQTVAQFLLRGIIAYLSWLGMLLIHECGHMINAVLSGGKVIRVQFPLFGFSQTFVRLNPQERLVAWGGPIWGVVIPLLFALIFSVARKRVPDLLKFFVGLCLIANGVYLAVGWTMHAGDAHDLNRLGLPPWILISLGTIWFLMGLAFGITRDRFRQSQFLRRELGHTLRAIVLICLKADCRPV